MPYDNPKQPIAAFLNIKRRKGPAAARAFAKKHRADLSKGSSARPYKARKGK